jgi:hypothetical protein
MIIGINGKINSGKDTVGRIIQYLMLNENTTKYFVKDWINKEHYLLDTHSNWEIKKFAGKLKQIASILTGATLEQLEDQDFKKQLLGPEWDQSSQYNGKECHECGSYGNTYVMSNNPTYRELLQVLGTEAMRNVLHENVWVNALMADYGKNVWDPTPNDFIEPNWIITDMRFPNEMDAIKAKGGITIRIQRFKQISENIRVHHGIGVPHPSETALDDHKFDYVIDNNGTISDLIDKVKNILTLNNII